MTLTLMILQHGDEIYTSVTVTKVERNHKMVHG